jgi:hypothetical protein
VVRYVAFDHQGKAAAYLQALDTIHQRTEIGGDPAPDFVIADNDVRGTRSKLERLRRKGARYFFLYPHAARPNLANDIRSIWQHTTASFVAASGHKEIMQTYGYDKPIHVVGWHLCPIRPFAPRENVKNVLFAPIHPRCAEIDKQVNVAVFQKLYDLAKRNKITLTIRFIKSLEQSGLYGVNHPNVIYTEGELTPSWSQIDSADIVVAHQTFAYIAVARGVPTLMMAEDMPAHLVPRANAVVNVRSWNKYSDRIAYPLDIMCSHNTFGMMGKAIVDDSEIAEWRSRMIGNAFDGNLFLEIIDDYLSSPEKSIDNVTMQGDGGNWWIVNPHGTIHAVDKEHAKQKCVLEDWRLATYEEIALFRERRTQTFDKPIGRKVTNE